MWPLRVPMWTGSWDRYHLSFSPPLTSHHSLLTPGLRSIGICYCSLSTSAPRLETKHSKKHAVLSANVQGKIHIFNPFVKQFHKLNLVANYFTKLILSDNAQHLGVKPFYVMPMPYVLRSCHRGVAGPHRAPLWSCNAFDLGVTHKGLTPLL